MGDYNKDLNQMEQGMQNVKAGAQNFVKNIKATAQELKQGFQKTFGTNAEPNPEQKAEQENANIDGKDRD